MNYLHPQSRALNAYAIGEERLDMEAARRDLAEMPSPGQGFNVIVRR